MNNNVVNDRIIIATCAFCGRWRDSLHRWWNPPPMVSIQEELRIIDLSHTYCPDCMRENDKMLGQIGRELADKEDKVALALVNSAPAPDDHVLRLLNQY